MLYIIDIVSLAEVIGLHELIDGTLCGGLVFCEVK